MSKIRTATAQDGEAVAAVGQVDAVFAVVVAVVLHDVDIVGEREEDPGLDRCHAVVVDVIPADLDVVRRFGGGTPHVDVLKQYRLHEDLQWVVEEGQVYLRQHGITVDPQPLAAMLPELFASAEFKGGLTCLG